MMKSIATIAVLALAGSAMADSQSFNPNVADWGAGADAGGDGTNLTPELVASINFNLPAVQSIDSLSLVLSHSFMSDVHVTLSNGSMTWILAQGDGPTGNPHQGTGDTSDLGDGGSDAVGALLYNFVASGGAVWNNAVLAPSPLPAGDYNALNFPAGAQSAASWTIEVYDSWDTLDDGYLGNVTLNYTVPTPGAVAAFGLAGLAAARRRR